MILGSPPRGRGKVVWVGAQCFIDRITPAWAGKRLLHDLFPAHKGDHPRVGGEKDAITSDPDLNPGSPPRGRGKVDSLS